MQTNLGLNINNPLWYRYVLERRKMALQAATPADPQAPAPTPDSNLVAPSLQLSSLLDTSTSIPYTKDQIQAQHDAMIRVLATKTQNLKVETQNQITLLQIAHTEAKARFDTESAARVASIELETQVRRRCREEESRERMKMYREENEARINLLQDTARVPSAKRSPTKDVKRDGVIEGSHTEEDEETEMKEPPKKKVRSIAKATGSRRNVAAEKGRRPARAGTKTGEKRSRGDEDNRPGI